MKKEKIRNIEKDSFYVLAETAFSHEGDLVYLKKLIDAASLGGADGIKFQMLLDTTSAYSPDFTIYEDLDKMRFSKDEWKILFLHAKEKALDIIVLPIEDAALTYCLENEDIIDSLEIHSINANEVPFLKKLSSTTKPVIIGTGGRSNEDIEFCMNIVGNDKKYIFMHGFQSFPTDYKNIKLSRIADLKANYNYVLGYADHTKFDDAFGFNLVEYAYLNGARIFEKHIVLKKGEKRVDYEAAVDKDDLVEIRIRLTTLSKVQSEESKQTFSEAEIKYKQREKQIVAIKKIKKGEVFSEENLAYRVTGEIGDFEQKEYFSIIGNKASTDIEKYAVIRKSNVLLK